MVHGVSYGDTRLGQGREKMLRTILKKNPELRLEIENKIRSKYNLPLYKEEILPEAKEGKSEKNEEKVARIPCCLFFVKN